MAKRTEYDKQKIIRSLNNPINVAKMTKIDSKKMILEFVSGEFSDDEAWFIKIDSGNEFVVLPENALNTLLSTLKANREEKLRILLKNEIKDLMPIDLEDAMVIAVNELEKYRLNDGSFPSINIKNIAKNIRTSYPNLFFNLGEIKELFL